MKRILFMIRMIVLLPIAWIEAIWVRRRPFEVRYFALQKWSRRVLKALDVSLTIEGVDRLKNQEAILFVCNHQGTLDPMVIVASCPLPMTFVSKTDNEKIPIIGSWIKSVEVILFDRDDRTSNIHMLREATRYLKQGRNLLIFPEGTRSKQDQMNPFKIGATQPAYLSKAKIVPVTLNHAYLLDQKGSKSKSLKISYGEPIDYEKYCEYDQQEIAEILYDKIDSKIEKSSALVDITNK